MENNFCIALVAHDGRKDELIDWCKFNEDCLSKYKLKATGTTAKLIMKNTNLKVEQCLSGPLGGDQQIGAMIAIGEVNALIFFCDNLITQGHQQDVGALSRLASLYNIPFATNRTTADMLVTSPLFGNTEYERIIPAAIDNYKNRKI